MSLRFWAGCAFAAAIVGSSAANPIIEGTFADPYALCAKGSGLYYVYPTQDMVGWGAHDLKVYSSKDLKTWTNEGVCFDLRADSPWCNVNLWAPTVLESRELDGTWRYYLYFTAKDEATGRGAIGVATSTSPTGPFRDVLGRPLVPSPLPDGMTRGQNIDPDVFRDPKSGKAYLYYGNSYLVCAELGADLTNIVSQTVLIRDTERGAFHYSEGPHVFWRKGIYYFTWSENDTRSPDYRVRYLMSDSPTAFVRGGQPARVEPACVVAKDEAKGILGTGHHSVLPCRGTNDVWKIFYHRLPPGKFKEIGWRAGYCRQTCMDELKFLSDGHIMPVEVTP